MTEAKIKWALDYSENVDGMASADNYAQLPQAEQLLRIAARNFLNISRGCFGTLMPQIPPQEALEIVSRDTYNDLLRNTPRNLMLPDQEEMDK